MRYLFAGGGTGGHINPALAIARYVKEKQGDAEILFVGSTGGMEERLVPAAGFDLQTVKVSGFRRKLNWKNIRHNISAVKKIFSATAESEKILKEFKPDICIGTGGYVCGPILRKAKKMGIPVLIHESNAFPGVTTKLLSKKADRILIAVEDAKKRLDPAVADKISVTGNPVFREFIGADKAATRKKLGLDSRPIILSFGGSLGAENVNRAIAELIVHTSENDSAQHIHAYGQYGKWFPALLAEKGVVLKDHPNLDIREYINNMPECQAVADIMICRSGAMSLTELQMQGIPSILIPSPNVAENHQYYNALALSDRGAAYLIEEKDLTGEKLCEMVDELLNDSAKRETFAANARKMAITDANERIYREIMAIVKK